MIHAVIGKAIKWPEPEGTESDVSDSFQYKLIMAGSGLNRQGVTECSLTVFFSYFLSFVYAGVYWNNHHHLLHMTPTGEAALSGLRCLGEHPKLATRDHLRRPISA